jgi:uracil phosphoribosyltransferase
MPPQVHVVAHPLVQHKLSLMRMKSTGTSAFRSLLNELGMLMAYEVTRDMPTHTVAIETPQARTEGIYIPSEKLGIRIEDDILVTATGSENLSAGAPRSAADIEKLMRN